MLAPLIATVALAQIAGHLGRAAAVALAVVVTHAAAVAPPRSCSRR